MVFKDFLDYFADLLRLKISYTKTNKVWIRSKKFSSDVFLHTRWKLLKHLNNSTFDLLGIKFSVTLDEISTLPIGLNCQKLK